MALHLSYPIDQQVSENRLRIDRLERLIQDGLAVTRELVEALAALREQMEEDELLRRSGF